MARPKQFDLKVLHCAVTFGYLLDGILHELLTAGSKLVLLPENRCTATAAATAVRIIYH